MLAIQRKNRIKDILLKEGSVKVADLVSMFGVSEETIRRDLAEFEREGFAKKNYGGAVIMAELQRIVSNIPPVQQRKFDNMKEKDCIGKSAALQVKEGQVILLDAGSTTWSLACNLKHLNRLTVITNSIDIAAECRDKDNWKVHVVGGQLIAKSMSLVGPNAEAELQGFNIDTAFLGTSGVFLKRGFTSSDVFESEVKKTMVKASEKVIILADHTKFARQGLSTFASFQEVDRLFTSSISDSEMIEQLRQKHSLEITICETY